jgi:hypothetical protein
MGAAEWQQSHTWKNFAAGLINKWFIHRLSVPAKVSASFRKAVRNLKHNRCQLNFFKVNDLYFKAPFPIKSRQGAIGRGRGWVKKTASYIY